MTAPTRVRRPVRIVGLPEQSEESFQAQILELAALTGWRTYHTYDSRRSTAGYPDLTLLRRPRIVMYEVKRQSGRVTPEQKQWIDEFVACGVSARVVRPSDWESIVEELAR